MARKTSKSTAKSSKKSTRKGAARNPSPVQSFPSPEDVAVMLFGRLFTPKFPKGGAFGFFVGEVDADRRAFIDLCAGAGLKVSEVFSVN